MKSMKRQKWYLLSDDSVINVTLNRLLIRWFFLRRENQFLNIKNKKKPKSFVNDLFQGFHNTSFQSIAIGYNLLPMKARYINNRAAF